MRKLIASAAVLIASSAFAAEELKFGDVNYFLKQGQMNLGVDVSDAYSKKSPNGSPDYETRSYLFETRYGYAFSDKLNVYLGLNYAYKNETEVLPEPNNNSWTEDGLANPVLAANYRLMNQNEARYNLDFGAVARLNLQDAERGSSVSGDQTNGNNDDGRQVIELNARMGRKFNEANEWQMAAGLIQYFAGEETVNAQAGNSKYDLNSSTDAFLRGVYQWRPVNEFMITTTFQMTRIGEYIYKNKTAGVKTTEEVHYDGFFEFRTKYLVTENILANFHYALSNLAEFDYKEGGVSKELKRRRSNSFGIGVDFLF
jgi:hypothetical protein